MLTQQHHASLCLGLLPILFYSLFNYICKLSHNLDKIHCFAIKSKMTLTTKDHIFKVRQQDMINIVLI